ncbi:MAG: hypothetical protein ACNA8H_16630, partial [Anaerolineales bacterium]
MKPKTRLIVGLLLALSLLLAACATTPEAEPTMVPASPEPGVTTPPDEPEPTDEPEPPPPPAEPKTLTIVSGTDVENFNI